MRVVRRIIKAGCFGGVLFLTAELCLFPCRGSVLDWSQQLNANEGSGRMESRLCISGQEDSAVDYETILEQEQKRRQAEVRERKKQIRKIQKKKEALKKRTIREVRNRRRDEEKRQREKLQKEEFRKLRRQIRAVLQDADGDWSVYVKDLKTEAVMSINSHSMYAPSLIKLYVMEYCYVNLEEIVENSSFYSSDREKRKAYVEKLLESMIESSDNESYNQLVRLQSESRSFKEGCESVEEYISETDYSDTGIYHTLLPSRSRFETTSNRSNHTSVEDCGAMLEAVYCGDCVSEEASAEMLELLTQQKRVWKIPAGISGDVKIANKTGETSKTQHDAAIVYGTDTDYILCVMSENIHGEGKAVAMIREISGLVYDYLNED